jgi:hypothetical protein
MNCSRVWTFLASLACRHRAPGDSSFNLPLNPAFAACRKTPPTSDWTSVVTNILTVNVLNITGTTVSGRGGQFWRSAWLL